MSFLKRIFASVGAAQPSPPLSQLSLPSGGHSRNLPGQDNASRRELLRLVLRDTLNRTGIPASWIGADLLAATSRGREPGIHVRLLLKHWDPRLMLHGIAFENSFKKRVLTLDSEAERWLLGISWQFSLADERACPAMPHPGVWTSSIPEAVAACGEFAADAAMSDRNPADLLGGSIVISGPAATPDSSAARPAAAAAVRQAGRHAAPEAMTDARAEAKADLERLFAIRDEDMKRHGGGGQPPQFAATEPAGLDQIPAASGDTEASALHKSFAKTDVFRRPDRTIAPVRQ
jgi:hypothetical protein